MTNWSVLDERQMFLEETFFARENEMLLERLRIRLGLATVPENVEEPAITDPALLSELAALGMSARSVKALALAPLVVVAWADGWLAEAERRALLVKEAEIVPVTPDVHEMISHWLDAPPDARLFDAWKHYIRALAPTLGEESWERLKSQTLQVARAVAKAGGGFLGRGHVTPSEEAILAEIESVFAYQDITPGENGTLTRRPEPGLAST